VSPEGLLPRTVYAKQQDRIHSQKVHFHHTQDQ
jgi:hypothetical protein